MKLIYSDSQIIDLEWLPNLNLGDYTICHSFEEYKNTPADIKLAFTTHRLHCDHDINCAAYQGFEDKINQLSAIGNLVFSFESELHDFHWKIWEECHHDNVYWVLPGTVNNNPNMKSHIVMWGDWFKTTSHIYKQLPNKLAEISHHLPKPKYFDALLGSPKPHRDFVANGVEVNNLQDKFIMTYGGKWSNTSFYGEGYFLWEPDVIPYNDRPLIGTAGPVLYHGIHTGLSRVIPIQVFNASAYSIIAETDHDNTLSFFSEKTAKPLIARRLFVAFTGYRFLENLREYGFQTFNNVIDESYDTILNDKERYTAAFEQVKRLCSMDQTEVYNRIKDVLEHNHQHIMQTNWTAFAAQKIQTIIDQTLV